MLTRTLAAVAAASALLAAPAPPRPAPSPAPADTTFPIPSSVRDEHMELMARLEAAMEERGPVGEAARELAAVLDPHFAREEQIALPPLGLLAPLAAGRTPPGAGRVLALGDSLRAEWPRMMDEHRRIRAAVDQLEATARAEGRWPEHGPLVELLRRHARMEEEVLYPAAVLAAEVARARLALQRR